VALKPATSIVNISRATHVDSTNLHTMQFRTSQAETKTKDEKMIVPNARFMKDAPSAMMFESDGFGRDANFVYLSGLDLALMVHTSCELIFQNRF
jgi:hypothetical protein